VKFFILKSDFLKGRQRSGHVGAKLIKGSSVPSPFLFIFTCFCKQFFNKVKGFLFFLVKCPNFYSFFKEGGMLVVVVVSMIDEFQFHEKKVFFVIFFFFFLEVE
jgi:hypothetical protein